MPLWSNDIDSKNIHLAVEGSIGGTTLGLQLAKQTIESGKRVLWASPELPDGTRFGQIFKGLDPVSASLYHAMNLVGDFRQSLTSLKSSANILPNVGLVVIDDYCPNIGRIPKDTIIAINDFVSQSKWATLLISKGGTSMDDRPLIARGSKSLNVDEIWLLIRNENNNQRILFNGENQINLKLEEDGFHN